MFEHPAVDSQAQPLKRADATRSVKPLTGPESNDTMTMPGVRCPQCQRGGKETWVIPGKYCHALKISEHDWNEKTISRLAEDTQHNRMYATICPTSLRYLQTLQTASNTALGGGKSDGRFHHINKHRGDLLLIREQKAGAMRASHHNQRRKSRVNWVNGSLYSR